MGSYDSYEEDMSEYIKGRRMPSKILFEYKSKGRVMRP